LNEGAAPMPAYVLALVCLRKLSSRSVHRSFVGEVGLGKTSCCMNIPLH